MVGYWLIGDTKILIEALEKYRVKSVYAEEGWGGIILENGETITIDDLDLVNAIIRVAKKGGAKVTKDAWEVFEAEFETPKNIAALLKKELIKQRLMG